jgi:hypothetical protein
MSISAAEPNGEPSPSLSVPPISEEEFRDIYERMYDLKAREIYVVMSPDKRSVMYQRGMNKPWTTKFRKLAEQAAKEIGGVVVDMDTTIKTMFAQLISKYKK